MDIELQALLDSLVEKGSGDYSAFVRACAAAMPEGLIAAAAAVHGVPEKIIEDAFSNIENSGAEVVTLQTQEPRPQTTPNGTPYLLIPASAIVRLPHQLVASPISTNMTAIKINGKWGLIGVGPGTMEIIEHLAARHTVSV